MGHKQVKPIKVQISERFNEITRYGVSRDDLKKWGNDDRFITSSRCRHTYQNQMNNLFEWCRNRKFRIKHTDDMKQYCQLYINWMIQEGYSASTQKTFSSAVNKFYGDDLMLQTQKRFRSDITKNRNPVKSLKKFNPEKNWQLVNFCQHTGLRRSELTRSRIQNEAAEYSIEECQQLNLKGVCLIEKDGDYYIHNVIGKGGKHRDVRILNNDLFVLDHLRYLSDGDHLFNNVHAHCPVHRYRSEYAKNMYKLVCSELPSIIKGERMIDYKGSNRPREYICRSDKAGEVYDRKALEITDLYLGHNRPDELVQSYFYK